MNELLIAKSATHKQNPSKRTEDHVLIVQLDLAPLLLLIEEGTQRMKSVKKPFSFRRRKAGLCNDGPYLGDCIAHNMKCLEGTPEDDKKEKLSQQVLKGNRSEKETKEQL